MTFVANLEGYTHDGKPLAAMLTDMVTASSAGLVQSDRGTPEYTGLWHGPELVEDCPGLFLRVAGWEAVKFGDFPATAGEVDRCGFPHFNPRVVLSLRRPCAPAPNAQGDVNLAAESADAEDLIVDARALQCTAYGSWPSILETAYGPGMRIQWGPMTPTAAGGFFGWDWTVFLEVKGCDCT